MAHRVAVGPLRTVHVGQNPALVAIDARDRHVFVANEGPLTADRAMPGRPGSVYVLDAHSGKVLYNLKVGAGPQDVVIDEIARCVFVTNEHDNTLSVFDATRL